MTLSASAVSKKRLDRIESDRPEVKDSASIDLEWIPYKGRYEHTKTKIFAACFCTNWGDSIRLHISWYSDRPNPEKALIQDILFYLNQFALTFGWYTIGVAVFDDTGNRIKGRDSDFFVLHQRCILYHITSPIEVKKTYARLVDSNKKHIDLNKIYSKEIIKNGVFNKRYRTDKLEDVAQGLLGIGKYTYKDPATGSKILVSGENVNDLPFDIQMRYVARDAELTMMLAYHDDCLALQIMKYIAIYSEMDYYRCCHAGVSQWYANIYKNMIKRRECVFEYNQNKKVPKLYIAGGNSIQPKKGFYKNQPVDELDVKGLYPTIAIEHNISFETVNCQCCQNYPVTSEVMDEINNSLLELKKETRTRPYWICHRIK
jgi:DNA polymerase I